MSNAVDFVEALLAIPVNLSLKDQHGFTALTYSALLGRSWICRALLKAGMNPTIEDNQGKNALDWALTVKDDDIVKILLEHTEAKGLTVLMQACREGQVNIVKQWLKAGANPMQTDARGRTALFHAVAAGHTHIVAELLKINFDLLAVDHSGKTVLDYAINIGNTEILALLLAHQSPGIPALNWAVSQDNLPLVQQLLTSGARVNAQNDDDDATALMSAAGSGNPDIVKALLKAGAQIDITDAYGKTAAHYAAEAGHAEIAKFLQPKSENPFRLKLSEQRPLPTRETLTLGH